MLAKRSKGFRLRPAARRDLQNIWRHTAKNWSVAQAKQYLLGLTEVFKQLAETPKIARLRTDIDPPVRVFRHASHMIILSEGRDQIDIIRIRHIHENWAADFGDNDQ